MVWMEWGQDVDRVMTVINGLYSFYCLFMDLFIYLLDTHTAGSQVYQIVYGGDFTLNELREWTGLIGSLI